MSSNLFVDECFMEIAITTFCKKNGDVTVDWKRPKDMREIPTLFKEDTCGEPLQGCLGNCWFVSACYILQHSCPLIKKIFGHYTEFSDENYVGKWTVLIYDCFREAWVPVVIDDQLPVVKNTLLFGSCSDSSQFWFPLLEKAFAKFYGSYEALNCGQVSEAFMLLTSGYCWRKLCTIDSNYELLKSSLTLATNCYQKMLAVVSFAKEGYSTSECDQPNVIPLHYYVINKIFAHEGQVKVELLCLHRESETKQSRSITLLLNSFCSLEATLTYCATDLSLVFGSDETLISEVTIQSAWTAGLTCGGRYQDSTFENNPQFLVSCKEPGFFYINLIQKSARGHSKRKEAEQAIALHVWKLSTAIDKPLVIVSLNSNSPDFSTSPSYEYNSNVSLFGTVLKDQLHFVVIPSTHSRDINCQFVLRICASFSVSVKHLKSPS